MLTTKLMTARELAELPDDGYRYELIRGELIRMPPPRGTHGIRQARIIYLFMPYADSTGGVVTGESGYRLEVDPDTVLAPDVAFIGSERYDPQAFEETYPTIPPHVAVEIDSRSNRPSEKRKKLRAYHDAGTRLVLFVNEERRTVTVDYSDGRTEVLREGDHFDGGDAMPGFRLAVTEFFR